MFHFLLWDGVRILLVNSASNGATVQVIGEQICYINVTKTEAGMPKYPQ